MKLGEKQELFAQLIAQHITWLYSKGYKVRGGDWFRDPRLHGKVGVKKAYGSKFSQHKRKCALDINLFKNGKFITSTAGHRESGEKWKSRHALCSWGGDFRSPDGNHYSLDERRS